MFKIAKLEQVNNEKVSINFILQEKNNYDNGKNIKDERFKTLSFKVSGNNYSIEFNLNCKLEKLLEIPMEETIDFKEYLSIGETLLNINGVNFIEPQINIKIRRYLKNQFSIFLTFNTEYNYDNIGYSGIVEFTFNLDNYLKK